MKARPRVFEWRGDYAWERWAVFMPGKLPVWFEHWYAAVAHAVYVARNPCVMEDVA